MPEYNLIEVRVSEPVKAADKSPVGKPGRWEDIKPLLAYACSNEDADSVAGEVHKITRRQVRWNWQGFSQGHYVGENLDQVIFLADSYTLEDARDLLNGFEFLVNDILNLSQSIRDFPPPVRNHLVLQDCIDNLFKVYRVVKPLQETLIRELGLHDNG